MKRYSAMILLVLFCLGMLSGCTRKEPEDTGSTGGNVLAGQTLVEDIVYPEPDVVLRSREPRQFALQPIVADAGFQFEIEHIHAHFSIEVVVTECGRGV